MCSRESPDQRVTAPVGAFALYRLPKNGANMKTEHLLDARRDAVWYDYATDVYTDTDITDKAACLADVFKGWWIDTYPDDAVTAVNWLAIADIYLDSAHRELSWTRDQRAAVGMFKIDD